MEKKKIQEQGRKQKKQEIQKKEEDEKSELKKKKDEIKKKEEKKINSSLTTLKLGENKISDAGAKAIGEALKLNSRIKDLYLDKNKITDSGVGNIVESIKVQAKRSTSEKLDVGSRVSAQSKAGKNQKRYPGKITKINANNTFSILFDDGDKRSECPKNELSFEETREKTNLELLQDAADFHVSLDVNKSELEKACQQLESGIKNVAKEMPLNLGVEKCDLEVEEKKVCQEPELGLHTLETEVLQLEEDLKVAFGKGNFKIANGIRLKLDIKTREMTTLRKKSAEKSKIRLEEIERDMYELIQTLRIEAEKGNFKNVPDLQAKIIAKKRELDTAKMKNAELKFTACMLVTYQKKTKDLSVRPIDDAFKDPVCECGRSFSSLLMLIRHQQSQPHCNVLEGSTIQFSIKGKEYIGKVINNITGEFPHEVRVEEQVHKMRLDVGQMRMIDSYGNNVAFKFLKQKKDNKEEEESNTENKENMMSQDGKNIQMKILPRTKTQDGAQLVEKEKENTNIECSKKMKTPSRFNKIVCVLENPNNINNVASIIGNVDIFGIGKLYIVDGLNILPNDWDTVTEDISSEKWTHVRTFKTTSECIAHLSKDNAVSVSTSPYFLGKKNVSLSQGVYTQPHLALWFGNEFTGLSDEAFQHSIFCIQVQIAGIVESLNVAVATGIIFAAVLRQRSKMQ